MAPEDGAPEAPVVPREAAPGGIPQGGSLGTVHLDAPSMPQIDPCAKRLGRFRIDFEALRKRKDALGDDDRPCRMVKRREYFAMNE